MMRYVSAIALSVMLAACAGGPPRLPNKQIDRILVNAPGQAQPGKVVASELAFARDARESGQWTAFRTFAAAGAIIHGRSGPATAANSLSGKSNPAETMQWGPRTVWMSCDGRLAISQGRFRNAAEKIGTFITVWEQQGSGEYRWTYSAASADNPQPTPRPASAPAGEDEIIVSGQSAIRGLVADCPQRRGGTVTPPPAFDLAAGTRHAVTVSRDGTMRWRWEHGEGGAARFVADYLADGEWQVAIDRKLPPTEFE